MSQQTEKMWHKHNPQYSHRKKTSQLALPAGNTSAELRTPQESHQDRQIPTGSFLLLVGQLVLLHLFPELSLPSHDAPGAISG